MYGRIPSVNSPSVNSPHGNDARAPIACGAKLEQVSDSDKENWAEDLKLWHLIS